MHFRNAAIALVVATVVVTAALAQGGGAARGGSPQARTPDPRDMGGGACVDNPVNCAEAARPIPAVDSVWVEELTWMEVRDAMNAGKRTAIIATGGIEPNGPYLALGKHNYVLRANCEAIARKLGDALCAPIVPFVPEGNIEPQTGHMRSPGTISMRQETYEALLTDIAHSLKVHGFRNIIFIGDSGGNQSGQKKVSETLNAKWADTLVAHIGEYYTDGTTGKTLAELGIKSTVDEKIHDGPGITFNMMVTDPNSVRWAQRVQANKATINGVSIADKARSIEIGKKIVDARTSAAAGLIRKAIAAKPR